MSADTNAQEIEKHLGESWLPAIYRNRVLKLRTRSYHFDKLPRSGKIAIQHTLLGVELKVGSRRFLCPDLATARYLSVFARAGCPDVAVPYDITRISILADELESSWFRMHLLIDQQEKNASAALRSRVRGLLIARIKAEINAAGAGARMPDFRHNTKVR